MADDDMWDAPSKTQDHSESNEEPPRGRVFGMRGRGFLPFEHGQAKEIKKRNSQNGERGFWNSRSSRNFNTVSSYEDDEEERYDDEPDSSETETLSRRENRRPRNGKEQKSEGGRGSFNDGDEKAKPKWMPYIPHPISEKEEELFSGGISSGINFSKYDEIEVNVSGENIPKKIEAFDEARLCPVILKNIKRCSFKVPTPIQKHALPIIMRGRDMMACAQTGSGKTAAFLIPIINCILEEELPAECGEFATPQILILTPTRELAVQIYVEAKKFTFGSQIKTEICYGGTALRYQIYKVRNGCNILIATPGRLIDFLNRGVVSLSEVRHFVFDEADRMLDMSFLCDIETVLKHATINTDNPAQILMFSATFPVEVQRLAKTYLKDYIFVAVGVVGGACMDVEQKFYLVSKFDKRSKLVQLLGQTGRCKTLVFVEKKRTADIIAAFLSEKDYPSTSMHGAREQILREEALNDFKSGKMDILVATAVAARGLDIKDVSHVINFDLPQSIEEYVHRIGRTGRVGNRGLASSFFDPKSDHTLAPGLVKILVQAEQEVPEFLQDEIQLSSWSSTSSCRFGERDIRTRESRGSSVIEAVSVVEEEVW